MSAIQDPKNRFQSWLREARDAAERWRKKRDASKARMNTDANVAAAFRKQEATVKMIEVRIRLLEEAVRSSIWTIPLMRVGLQSEMGRSKIPLEYLDRGARVKVLGYVGDWYKVRTDSGREGWLIKAHLIDPLPVELSSLPGKGGVSSSTINEIELGIRDTMIR